MGFGVILHYRTSNTTAKSWIKKNPQFNDRIFFIQADLTGSPEKIIDQAAALPGRLVGLVNNASLFSHGNLNDINHFNTMMDIHVNIPTRLGTRFAQLVTAGWILNISDAVVSTPHVKFQNYRISKLFLNEITRQQAFLFAPNIRVNAIAPGATLRASIETKKRFTDLRHHIPLRKTGSLHHIAEGFRFLVTNSYCTGQIIFIDGGWHLI